MYDELIKKLHNGAEFLELSTPGMENSFAKMLHDAIEKLLVQLKEEHDALIEIQYELQDIRSENDWGD